MSKKLFVGNLDWAVTSDELRDLFSKFGEIEDAVVITDRFSGRSKGFGFVTFTDGENGDAAVAELDQSEYKGRKMVVNEARPPQPRD
jgi:RNA recognition motif-containing protein